MSQVVIEGEEVVISRSSRSGRIRRIRGIRRGVIDSQEDGIGSSLEEFEERESRHYWGKRTVERRLATYRGDEELMVFRRSRGEQ